MYEAIECSKRAGYSFLENRMPRFVDRTGHRYIRLTAVEHVGTNHYKKPLWRCICDCGNEVVVNSSALGSGNTLSCNCSLTLEEASAARKELERSHRGEI